MLQLMCLLLVSPGQDFQNVVDALRKLDRVVVRFQQETYSDFMDPTTAEGTLSIQRPGKLRMDYTRGERKYFVCDGITYYEKDVLADSESRVAFEDLRSEPLVRLLLFGDDPGKHFLIDEVKGLNGKPTYRLKPRDDDSYHLEVSFDEAWMPVMLEVLGEDGEGTRFQFVDWNLKPTFAPDAFVVPSPEEP